ARVTDVAKRRRQELESAARLCLPEGPIYARSGVALAPTFLGLRSFEWIARSLKPVAVQGSSSSLMPLSAAQA
ncbi:MAG TPA: hypothetical protein VNW68_02680, partial [Candidatus Limnocylindria bacterium]|nr:hypothetical protein [Candidatus Limnocylindria bacterium]